MAFFGLGGKGKSDGGDDAEARNPKKARRFFDHAKTVSDARNYDYAIECFINGLRFDPESMPQHEALREVALRRMASGAKTATMKEKLTYAGGKTPLDKMLNAEFLWSKDPRSGQLALAVMENAVAANIEEVAYWVGDFVLEGNRASKSPSKAIYMKACDLFAQISAYDKAGEACRLALHLDPSNAVLIKKFKDMEAEQTMQKARYGEEGSFRTSMKDADKQRQLEQEDSIAASGDAQDQVIARNEAAWKAEPDNIDTMLKLVRSLLQKEEEGTENRAISVLDEGFKKFNQYRFKVQIGDVKIKQYNRRGRLLKQQIVQASDDEQKKELTEQFKALAAEQVKFELDEFTTRVQNYPTDMGLKFQLGRRQFAMALYDDAIASFQEAQADPKHRSQALRYLGEGFAKKGWLEEAIDTFRRGIDAHPHDDDRLALELRYELMKVLCQHAKEESDLSIAEESGKIASQIAQADINYKDIRAWIDKIRSLVKSLKDTAPA